MSLTSAAGSYTLTDGTKVAGDPVSENENGVVLQTADGTDLERIPYDKFTQESVRDLLAGAKSAREKAFIDPFIEELPQERAQRKEIIVKPIETPPRPTAHLGLMAIFASPVGLTILLVLYGANLFAAFEVALYRRQPLLTVCGLAAVPLFGVLSPIIFLAMPGRQDPNEAVEEQQIRFRATPPPAPDTAVSSEPAAAAPLESQPIAALRGVGTVRQPAAPVAQETAPALPEPIVFRRGEFSFNRRFFETKLAGFFRLVPGEAERDMVIFIKSGRGDFTGRRITRITPSEFYLQIFHDNATADEMIPFVDVLEVQIRHKDFV
ncbi:MAG: hypothetical protein ABSA83_16110 [Verrucomicrobiota bacterium]